MKITISGDIGSGKSTVGKLLAKKLNYKHFSSGDFVRAFAKENNMTLDEYQQKAEQDIELDKRCDAYVAKVGNEEDNFIMDTRLGWHFIPDSFKIYLEVSKEVGAQRIFNQKRDDESQESIKKMIEETTKRRESENKRYEEYYKVNVEDKSQYDLVVDTENLNAEQVTQQVLDSLPK